LIDQQSTTVFASLFVRYDGRERYDVDEEDQLVIRHTIESGAWSGKSDCGN
jgi:hypothetical protein